MKYNLMELAKDSCFRNFTSTISHMLKDIGDIEFVQYINESIDYTALIYAGKLREALYLISCTEYLCGINNLNVPDNIIHYQNIQMPELIFPDGAELYTLLTNDQTYKQKQLAIPEFLSHNIVETDLRGAC